MPPLLDKKGRSYEVFIRPKRGLSHRHVGSLWATDEEMAVRHARDVYTRRQEGVSIWVVASEDVKASDPDDKEALYEPAESKDYRYAEYYKIPDEIERM